MTSIESSLHPLVFPVANLADSWRPGGHSREFPLAFRTCARALAGMQKEAVVSPAVGPAWRMVCDEGPYLLGTDLAPFPLAFFCVGMLSGYATELLALAKGHSLPADWELVQDNRYTMEGSATAGTMRGAALPVELELRAGSEENHGALQALLVDAVAASPAGALLRATHNGRFALQHNGKVLQPARVLATTPSAVCPMDFDLLQPAPAHAFPSDIISKLQSAPLREGVSGGVGSSLTNDQKRTLHMQGRCRQRDDGLLEITVELFSPLGSRFRFLVEPGEECKVPRAPSPAMYLSAGIAFCYLTQMGRYAHIVRKPLTDYRLVQDSAFGLPGASSGSGRACSTDALLTEVFIQSTADDEFAKSVVSMSEQTCFLHAACREVVPVRIKGLRSNVQSP